MKNFTITYKTRTSVYNRTSCQAPDRYTAIRNMQARGYNVISAVCCD